VFKIKDNTRDVDFYKRELNRKRIQMGVEEEIEGRTRRAVKEEA
jgi:hypothetical protein